jgi:hypothetical protein
MEDSRVAIIGVLWILYHIREVLSRLKDIDAVLLKSCVPVRG